MVLPPTLESVLLGAYFVLLSVLFVFGVQGYVMVYIYRKHLGKSWDVPSHREEWPKVTVQLPGHPSKLDSGSLLGHLLLPCRRNRIGLFGTCRRTVPIALCHRLHLHRLPVNQAHRRQPKEKLAASDELACGQQQ